jgi:hypothetical protein
MQVGDKVRLLDFKNKGKRYCNLIDFSNKVVTISSCNSKFFYSYQYPKQLFLREDIAEYVTEDTFDSQVKQVLNHLQESTITSWEAINKYGITRLSAIIFVLRKDYTITSTRRSEGKKWWTEYKLIK